MSTTIEYQIVGDNGEWHAGSTSIKDALHYLAVYRQDGPVHLEKVTREVIDLTIDAPPHSRQPQELSDFLNDFKPSWTISLNGTAVTVDFNNREDAERFMGRVEALDLTSEGEAAEETIVIGGRPYRKFIRYPDEVDDGTCRCIRCGQIDEPDYHDDEICRDSAAPQPAQPDLESRDIWECANQLFGYIGPSTPDNLVAFLNREGHAALNLAHRLTDAQARIAALTAKVKALTLNAEELDTILAIGKNEQSGRVTNYELQELVRVYREILSAMEG